MDFTYSYEAETFRIWQLRHPLSEADLWNEGQVEIRAIGGLDYSAAFAMVRGAYNTGHFALDDFTFTKVTECSVKPSYARVPTNESKISD